jgi:hypothetical protein
MLYRKTLLDWDECCHSSRSTFGGPYNCRSRECCDEIFSTGQLYIGRSASKSSERIVHRVDSKTKISKLK